MRYFFIILALLMPLLAGCGQTGALFLPPPPGAFLDLQEYHHPPPQPPPPTLPVNPPKNNG